MNAFIAAVPSHIINTLQFIHVNGLKHNDLYLIPATANAAELKERLESLQVFDNIIMLKDIMVSYPVTASQMLRVAAYRFPTVWAFRGKKYDSIFYNIDGWYANSIIYHSVKKLNKNAGHYFLENGVNPYCRSYEDKEWYLRLFINLMGMTCMDGRFITARYLYEPGAVCVPQKGELRQLPKINKEDAIIRTQLNSVFGYQEDAKEFEGKKYIIMEQGPLACNVDMYELWSKVLKLLPTEKVILKSHPRQKESKLQKLGLSTCKNYRIPWEIYTLNMNTENKVILSIFSTSCVAPKLMFDSEPRVILLYKLLGVDYSFLGQGLVNLVERIGSMYRDHSKFFVPETFEDLERYLKQEVATESEEK